MRKRIPLALIVACVALSAFVLCGCVSGGGAPKGTAYTNENDGITITVPEGFTIDDSSGSLVARTANTQGLITAYTLNSATILGRTMFIYDAKDLTNQAKKDSGWLEKSVGLPSDATVGDFESIQLDGHDGYCATAKSASATYQIYILNVSHPGVLLVITGLGTNASDKGASESTINAAVESIKITDSSTLDGYQTYTCETKGFKIANSIEYFGGTVSVEDTGITAENLAGEGKSWLMVLPVPSSGKMTVGEGVVASYSAFSEAFAGALTLDSTNSISEEAIGRDTSFVCSNRTANNGAFKVDFYVTKANGTSGFCWAIVVIADSSAYELASNQAKLTVSSFQLLAG